METRVFESKFNVFSVPKPLTKAQMIRYKGGNGYGGYGGYIKYGTCHALSESKTCHCFQDRAGAIFFAGCADQENGTNCTGNWCCDSCGSASWVGPSPKCCG